MNYNYLVSKTTTEAESNALCFVKSYKENKQGRTEKELAELLGCLGIKDLRRKLSDAKEIIKIVIRRSMVTDYEAGRTYNDIAGQAGLSETLVKSYIDEYNQKKEKAV